TVVLGRDSWLNSNDTLIIQDNAELVGAREQAQPIIVEETKAEDKQVLLIDLRQRIRSGNLRSDERVFVNSLHSNYENVVEAIEESQAMTAEQVEILDLFDEVMDVRTYLRDEDGGKYLYQYPGKDQAVVEKDRDGTYVGLYSDFEHVADVDGGDQNLWKNNIIEQLAQMKSQPIIVEETKAEVKKVRLGDLRERLNTQALTSDEREFIDSLRKDYYDVARIMRKGGSITDEQNENTALYTKLVGGTTFTQPLMRNAQGSLFVGAREEVEQENGDDELIEIKVHSHVRSSSNDRSR
ncbi:MAG: hypothetical protein HOM96_02065, partial [Rickettsiales bacterium]|nr:hypothetical protein [Rickettsiales bacterium]